MRGREDGTPLPSDPSPVSSTAPTLTQVQQHPRIMANMNANDVTPFCINGKEHIPDKTFDVFSPTTGELAGRAGSAAHQDVEQAVNAAAAAFPKWKKTGPTQRRDLFLKAGDVMEKRREELIQCSVDEIGGTFDWGAFNVDTAINMLRDVAGRVTSIEGSIPMTQDPERSCMVVREAYGVVLSIAPWNAAYILGLRSVVYPIAAGNTVVFKTSEFSPRTHWMIASILQEAGFPDGVLNTICCEPSSAPKITSALISNPHVRKINFTGSTNVGRIIGRLAGENLKPVVLELGGKAPAIVWEDANLETAALQCALGSFLNSGQICMSTKQFQEKLKASIDQVFSADGPSPVLINDAAVKKNKALLNDATSKGAIVLFGDPSADEGRSNLMRPVVLGNITPAMDIYKTESFGPTVSIIEIDTEEQAVDIANDTEYGLTSAVFTEDLRRGLRFARQIESGAVHINSMTVHDEPFIPHGGTKMSGHGRFNSTAGILEWTWTKNIFF
ncbi:Aldehyde/histidinol dehydrogenase [Emericellopsis atlantica]|uniref:Aldehyde/histidinol dehydrogenase n=1 Tax=Emericellopsis atlantica TaxID=2614577 RepID=A0A9P7ZPH8_9HYPO|nr:Aldehyde/histidinol dehydrogenase [Emericellopsis atlantica]KAG9255904.1 Aldehyde/histidinol dehydrogenase [Emericellopsis atlantica]